MCSQTTMPRIGARLDEQQQAGGKQRKAETLGGLVRSDNERMGNEKRAQQCVPETRTAAALPGAEGGRQQHDQRDEGRHWQRTIWRAGRERADKVQCGEQRCTAQQQPAVYVASLAIRWLCSCWSDGLIHRLG